MPGAKPVTIERITVHGAALEGNLEGNSADRDVLVALPPSYATEKSRRYPVVYALHGYSMVLSNGRVKSTCRRRLRAPSLRAQGR